MSSNNNCLDSILVEIGAFGKYQRRSLVFLCIAIVYSVVQISYVFTTRDIEYRCKISECDSENSTYSPHWLENAVPFKGNVPAKCYKYQALPKNLTKGDVCRADFDKENERQCNSWIYSSQDASIVHDFNIHCQENLWKLTLIGTINSVGQFMSLPISGFISDSYGRRTLFVTALVLTSFAGLARSFSPSYLWFAFFEFLDTFVGSGAYSCGFILGMELVEPQHRVLMGSFIACCYSIGEVIISITAWLTQSWRLLLRVIYAPGVLLITYFWLTPESIRWLLSKRKYQKAKDTLNEIAKVNKKTISESVLQKLTTNEEKNTDGIEYPIFKVFHSVRLLLRLLTCSFCWITCAFVFYGITITSVALAGNSYINFIFTALAEIPGHFASYMLLDKLGRKPCLSISYLIAGAACFIFILVPDDAYWTRLCCYILGKFGITATFTIIYVFTSELFPTPLRQSLMGTCSMLGRIGSMSAPQAPLLAQLWTPLPLVMYGSMSAVAAILTLMLPETLNIKLPDSIEEAESIGKVELKSPKIFLTV